MSYKFTESALDSLLKFEEETASRIQNIIKEASKQDFYNHSSYSYSYDNHGNPWDKLDIKRDNLNYRVFFTNVEETFYILEVFQRDDLEYDKDLYNLLKKLEDKVEK